MNLQEALSLPLGRSISLSETAAAQLVPRGTLMRQAAELHRAVTTQASLLLQEPLPLRRISSAAPHLTEHEHPTWPLLALGTPPIYTPQQTRDHLARVLGLRARVTGEGWADVLALSLVAGVQPLLLGRWGILLPWACLYQQSEIRPEIAALAAELRQQPEVNAVADPLEPRWLARRVVWTVLALLHGGLPLPSEAEVVALAQAPLTLRERTQVAALPAPAQAQALLRGYLPALPEAQVDALLRQFAGEHLSDDPAYLTGIEIIRQPGQVALWRRSRSEVQLIVTQSPRSALPVAWVWSL